MGEVSLYSEPGPLLRERVPCKQHLCTDREGEREKERKGDRESERDREGGDGEHGPCYRLQ